ncbi:MAG: hypothetical protein IPO20_14170 [Gammaproteobacteria bacterium]|nr:hypothetical protein [Gammaproteobacteria bacterium]
MLQEFTMGTPGRRFEAAQDRFRQAARVSSSFRQVEGWQSYTQPIRNFQPLRRRHSNGIAPCARVAVAAGIMALQGEEQVKRRDLVQEIAVGDGGAGAVVAGCCDAGGRAPAQDARVEALLPAPAHAVLFDGATEPAGGSR